MLNSKSKNTNKKAVVLLSGGLDSVTTLYYAKHRGYKCYNLIFDYEQRHRKEIKSARKISEITKCRYYIIKFNLPWQGSTLLNKKESLIYRKISEVGKYIPATYVPGRNTIFLSFAISFAETINAGAVFIGANAVDFSGYPDCRPEYYDIFNKLISVGTKKGIEKKGCPPWTKIRIIVPFVNKSKSDIVRLGWKLGIPYELTWSCYEGRSKPCMKCDSCLLRIRGFKEAKLSDPLLT